MLKELMAECRNYFESGYVETEFRIENGVLQPHSAFAVGQYIAITGSTFSDGVYQCIDGVLTSDTNDEIADETFDGKVWALNVPPDFIRLARDIDEFEKKRPSAALASESFGGYSHTLMTGSSGAITWQEVHKDRIRPYRKKMFSEVRL